MNVTSDLDPRFSSADATPTPWGTALNQLEAAKTYTLVTVRPDGRPHATTIAGVVLDGIFQLVTGEGEQKARNLAAGNPRVIVSCGCNGWEGLDIVIEGEAIRVTEEDRLSRIVDAFTTKYDDYFSMRLVDGRIDPAGSPTEPLAFEVRPRKAFGFGKGSTFSQTLWRFRDPAA
jgi:hypothetical protein